MNVTHYQTRHAYHQRWAVKYSLASVACYVAWMFAWPRMTSWLALGVAYLLARASRRERRRAHQVIP